MLKMFKLSHWLHTHNLQFLGKIIYYLIYLLFNSSVPATVRIGSGSKFAYGGIGMVIHGKSIIGENCIIGQGITIGGRSKHTEVPEIGDFVYIGAGARILGPIKIGSHVVIGPNAVVIKDIPPNSIVVGVPAKVISECRDMRDFV